MCLLMLLNANSRLSYAELAEKLGLSVNAVHKRIQLLVESGVIRKFTAKLGAMATPFVTVYLSGTSHLASVQGLPEKLATQGSIYWLAVGGGKFLYIGANLRNLNDLEALVNYVKQTAGIVEPTVGIRAMPPPNMWPQLKPADLALCDLDLRIIRSLKDNSRKTIADVSDELGVSAKTVRRRLQRMIKNYLIDLGLEWYPDKSNDIMTLVEVRVKPDADMNVIPFRLSKKYTPNTLFSWHYANIPNVITIAVWTNSMKELESLREKLMVQRVSDHKFINSDLAGFFFQRISLGR